MTQNGLKSQLQELLRRVPPKVLEGSYQFAVAYKKWASKASSLVESTYPSGQKMTDAIKEHGRFL